MTFRYTVVALISVFVALAGGLVLGAAAPGAPADDPAHTQAGGDELRDRVDELTAAVAEGDAFAEQVAPTVLAGRLAGDRVLLLSTAGGSSYVEGVARMLALGGADVTGRLTLTDAFTDPRREDELLDLAHASLPPSVAAGVPSTPDGVDASAALLAAVLLSRTPEVTDGDRRSVLTAYATEGFITAPGDVTAPADAVVVVAGDGSRRDASLTSIVAQFAAAGRVVVTAAGEGGVVARLRADPDLAANVSTVDNIGTPQGRLVAAWAVADQIAGRAGHYGTGPAAAPLPTTTPSKPPQ